MYKDSIISIMYITILSDNFNTKALKKIKLPKFLKHFDFPINE